MIIDLFKSSISTAKKMYRILERGALVNPKKSKMVSWYEDNCLINNDVEVFFQTSIFGEYAIEWRTRPKVKFSGVGIILESNILMCDPSDSNSYYVGGRKAVVSTRRGRLVQYTSSPHFLSSSFFSSLKNIYSLKSKPKIIEKGVALLGQGGGEISPRNYYHFWTDVVGDLWHIKKMLPKSELPDFYLVNFSELPWQWEILKMCGLKEEQVIPYSRHRFLHVVKLIFSFRDKGATNIPFWLSTAIHDISGWRRPHKPGFRKIFISRSDASRRLISNEDILRQYLCHIGFEVFVLDRLSVKQQQDLFASASVICSPHGAALTNLIWCGPGTVIIDILSEGHLVPCFRELSRQNSLLYFPIVCEAINKEENGLNSDIKLAQWKIDYIGRIVDQHAGSLNFHKSEPI